MSTRLKEVRNRFRALRRKLDQRINGAESALATGLGKVNVSIGGVGLTIIATVVGGSVILFSQ